jgi:hypothetical protein
MPGKRRGLGACSRANRAFVTPVLLARLLDSAGRPARFIEVTAAPLDCGAVFVWLVDEAETCSPHALANAGL